MTTNTLPLIWTTTALDFLIMLTRLGLRRWRGYRFDAGDIIALALICLNWAHAATIHVVITGGKDGMTEEYRISHRISMEEAHRRQLGSKLLLLGRTEIVTYLWGQKILLFVFYRGLVHKLKWERVTLWTFWTTFALSYIAVVIATFSECRPLSRFWIVKGNETGCERGAVQLYVQGGLNIATDIMLIVLPLYVLCKVQRRLVQKIQLGILFGLGVFCILTTAVRLQQNSAHKLTQTNRSTWANSELLAATIVANAPSIYVALRPRPKSGYDSTTFGQIHVSRSFVVGSFHPRETSLDKEIMGTEVEIWTPERNLERSCKFDHGRK